MRFDRSGRLAAAPATSTVTAAATAAAALLLLLAPQLSPLPARAAEAPPDVIVHGEEPRDDFGWAVCPAGDVNGDGEPDLLVTAPSYHGFADWAGRAYLFYGPLDSQLDASHADATITAEAFGDNLGFSAAGGFDIDGDGFDDLIVGARSNDGNGIQAGRAYVFRGPLHGDRPATSADVIVSGDEFDELGRAVAAGDLNGDGHDDLVIAAPLASQGPISSGAVYVYFGPVDGSLGTAGASASITGVLFNEELGSSLAIGDLNGDGVDDLAIGAPRPPVNGADTGRTYVFFGPIEGGPRNAEQAEVTVFGEDLSDAFGTSVAIGDVDGDGLGDLVAGAPQIFEGGPGKAYVMLSPLDAVIQAGSADAILTGEEPGDVFGNAVAVLPGDSGHGAGAVLAGAWDDNAGGTRAGRAYLFRGPLAGARSASSADLFVTGGPGPDQLGLSVANAGDLNGDGRADILAGAPQFDDQGAGFAVVVYRALDPAAVSEPDPGLGGPARSLSIRTANPAAVPVGIAYELRGHGASSREVADSVAQIEVRDVTGRLVWSRTVDARGPAGATSPDGSVEWDGRDPSGRLAPAGVYFLRLTQGRSSAVKRIVLVNR